MNNTNITNLTVIDLIESKQIKFSSRFNYFTSSNLNISLVKRGYIPMIRLVSGSLTNNVTLVTKLINDLYPDYVCLDSSLTNGTLIGLRNLKTIQSSVLSKTSNIAVLFSYEDPILVNLTSTYAYSSLGTFQPYLYTKYGGNLYATPNTKLIMIRNVDQYPFQSKNFIFFMFILKIYILKCLYDLYRFIDSIF
jgi:hypothetical protein